MTSTLRSCIRTLVAASVVSTMACSSSSNSTPTGSDYDDVAQSLSATITASGGGGELGSLSDTASLAVGVTPHDVSLNAEGTFGVARAGLNYSYALTCADGQGGALPHCGATTNAADASVSWTGNLSLPSLTASVERSGHWTLTGISSGTGTLNGDGHFTFDAQFQSLFRNEQGSAHLSFTSKYDAVRFDMTAHHPTGGSVSYAVEASHQGSAGQASFAIDAVLTFNADGSAKLVLDGAHAYALSATGWVVKL